MSYDEDLPEPLPADMGTLTYALAHSDLYMKYVQLRVHGVHSTIAFRQVFPIAWTFGNNGPQRYNYVEFNPFVISRLRDALAVVKPHELWNPNISVHEMLSLARDPDANPNSRLGAMKELNIMLDITFVDANGKTTKGRSLDHFYAELEASDPAPQPPAEDGA